MHLQKLLQANLRMAFGIKQKDGWDEDQFSVHLNYLPEPIFLFIVFKENFKTKTNFIIETRLTVLVKRNKKQ